MEIWKAVDSYNGIYEVSNHGRVRSLDRIVDGHFYRGRVLKFGKHEFGYRTVKLYGKVKPYDDQLVQHLVANAFIGLRPVGLMCCHNDGDPTNNQWDNLRWDTQAGNLADRVRHCTTNRGSKHGMAKLDENRVRDIKASLKMGVIQREIARTHGVSFATVTLIKQGKVWGWL